MQLITIIGNLTRDPEMFGDAGHESCNFTVAVNSQKRKANSALPEHKATYYKVRVWGELGKNCKKYLTKGRKVSVAGELDASIALDKDGKLIFDQKGMPVFNLNISSPLCVEFLNGSPAPAENTDTKPAEPPAEDRNTAPAPMEVPPDGLPF